MVRPGRDLLSGVVQVDETYIGGVKPGLVGGRASGKKVLTGIAVEVHERGDIAMVALKGTISPDPGISGNQSGR